MITSSAPGSVMLLGEHAVLHGEPALVAAVSQRMHVTLTPRTDNLIHIHSALGQLTTNLDALTLQPPFQFVLQTIRYCRHRMHAGFDLHIHSEFSHQIGLGSSAAVTVALLAAIYTACSHTSMPHDLIREAREIIRLVQGSGSGADAAASVLGGVVHYAASPSVQEKLTVTPSLTLLYCGFKTKTADVIQMVQEKFKNQPNVFAGLCREIGDCVRQGLMAIKQEDWQALGNAMDQQQIIMQALGVSLPILDDMILLLKKQPSIWGAKISGSGWGDCVIGLGASQPSALFFPSPHVCAIPITISLRGVICEKN